jgi:hypothetical protein
MKKLLPASACVLLIALRLIVRAFAPGAARYRALAGRLNLALAAERRAKGGEHVRQDLANGHFTR